MPPPENERRIHGRHPAVTGVRPQPVTPTSYNARVPRIRQLLVGVIILGSAGSLTDLVLLRHYEDTAQLIPLALLVAALVLAVGQALRQTPGSLRIFRAVMLLSVAAGLAGIGFHFDGAAEFQREIDPSLGWWPLVLKVARSQVPPLLAPGAMVQLGLIGLVYTFRHPGLSGSNRNFEEVKP